MVLRLMGRDENSFIIGQNERAKERSEARNGKDNNSKLNSQSINMSSLGLNQDSVLMRKQFAKGRAMKIIHDAWSGDKKVDMDMDEIRSRIKEAKADISEYNDYIQEYKDKKEQLKEYYGIEDGDYAQEDIDLLKKKRDAANNPGITFTEEEQKRLAELEGSPLAKYQEETAGLDDGIALYEKKIDEAWEEVRSGNAQLTGMKIERLKYHEMADAQNKADKIMADASREVIGMLAGEAQDHIKEEFEEKIEEAKKEAEEKEEKEEKLEEQREEKEEFQKQLEIDREESREAEKLRLEQEKNAREQSDLIEGARSSAEDPSGLPSQVKAEIKEMLQKMKLLEEDLKGAEIDDTI